jgi:negative regulator of flagellin synthesis FlgM
MKVNNDANNAIQGLTTSKTGLQKKGKVEKNTGGISHEAKNDSAKVDLSDRAQEMKKLKELAMQTPDVNMEKVRRFQELIDKGNYKVDSKKVADKMVEEHLHTSALTEES